tara:strand:+ start:3908 stop:4150 length:243 start_codon:yes stop_codon:yes gene_type:complete
MVSAEQALEVRSSVRFDQFAGSKLAQRQLTRRAGGRKAACNPPASTIYEEPATANALAGFFYACLIAGFFFLFSLCLSAK